MKITYTYFEDINCYYTTIHSGRKIPGLERFQKIVPCLNSHDPFYIMDKVQFDQIAAVADWLTENNYQVELLEDKNDY